MPELTLEELSRQLREAEHPSQAHSELIQAIDDLHQATLPFRRFRGRKMLPKVSARDKTCLMELHQQIGAKAETLLAGGDSPALKSLVKKIAALSSMNYNALLQYNPNAPRTLDSLEEQSRTVILHVGRNEFGRAQNLGANLSERMPLALFDDQGNKISGLFTKKKLFQVQEPFRKAVEAALAAPELQNNEVAKTAFQLLLENIGKPLTLRHPKTGAPVQLSDDPANNILAFLRMCTGKGQNGKRLVNLYLYDALKQSLPEQLALQLRPEMCFALTNQLEPIRNPIALQLSDAKIQEGQRLDNRNAAMSAVADLLGMPRIVARSRPMKIVDENGREIEGTFMELATGLDIKNLNPTARGVGAMALENTMGMGCRDIANLQILDYLCGNVDRHAGNMAYQLDWDSKFNGVQGFDNDCAFCALVLGSGAGKNRLVGVRDMRAIPASTYLRVMQLTPATLKYALRGFGLSEEELEAAGKRLRTLQRDLRNEKGFYEQYDRQNPRQQGILLPGHTRILQDHDWKDYPMDQFSTELDGTYSQNTFALAHRTVSSLGKRWQDQEKQFNDLSQTVAAGIRNRAYRSTAAREERKAAWLQTLLNRRTWLGFSSGNYENMQNAVKNYWQAEKQLADRLKAANREDAKRSSLYQGARDAVVTREDLERLRQLSAEMKNAAQTYLNGKLVNGQVPENASDYTKQRIEAARLVLSYSSQGDTLRPEETRKAQANEAEANQHMAQRKAIQVAEVPKTPEISKIPENEAARGIG